MTELSERNRQIEEFSFFGWDTLELENFEEIEEILLKLASRLRQNGASYDIRWSGRQTPFRLRSENPVDESTPEISIAVPQGGKVGLKINGISKSVRKALVQELEMLLYLTDRTVQGRQEKDLNLLFPSSFETEVKTEFSRWQQQGLPFWLLRLELSEKLPWRRVTRTLKHATGLGDKICKVSEQLLLVLFIARSYDAKMDSELSSRLNRQHSSAIFKLHSLHVPGSCQQWSEIKNFMKQ